MTTSVFMEIKFVLRIELGFYCLVRTYQRTGGTPYAVAFDVIGLFYDCLNAPDRRRLRHGPFGMEHPFYDNSRFYRKYGTDRRAAPAPLAAVITPPDDIRKVLDRQLVIVV